MSAGLIVLIVVVALIIIGLVFLMPRMRAKAEERKAARELESRRDRVATENREAASTRSTRAERAEQEAKDTDTEPGGVVGGRKRFPSRVTR